MLRGILTAAAAERIKRPELACVEIGPRGIRPIQEGGENDNQN